MTPNPKLDLETQVADLTAAFEAKQPRRLDLKAQFKKRPGLFIGLGVVAVGAVAAVLGRGAILKGAGALSKAARPMAARTVRPLLIDAARRRPIAAARLAARFPKTSARLVAALR
jgi:hypothetical protein